MAIAYCIIASITCIVVLSAFFKDKETNKLSLRAWIFIAITTLLWPITLPFIISSKLRAAKARQQSSATFNPLKVAPATSDS
ncbi:MAG: hypothetical protein WA885_16710 [Phormidesmis sp.]